MGLYKYLSQNWQNNDLPAEQKRERLVKWRREPVTLRIDRPTRLDRAKSVGYRAKPGILVVRQRVGRGSHTRPDWSGGRHSSNMGIRMNLRKSYQLIAEERANKSFPNCEVLNSYYVLEDGKHYWFEVILLDRAHPSVLADKRTNMIALQRGRVYRGLTSAGKRTRGLHNKGMGSEKARPSRRAHKRSL